MRTNVKLFSPFGFIGWRTPTAEPADDLRCYGFSLDLTTECYFYTYDWGYGFNFRLLGFGFEVSRFGS